MSNSKIPPAGEEPGILITPPDDLPRDTDSPTHPHAAAGGRRADRRSPSRPVSRMVGLGGSAGSLVAFELFLAGDAGRCSGMVFVVVTHLLARPGLGTGGRCCSTSPRMPVQEATDGLRVRA